MVKASENKAKRKKKELIIVGIGASAGGLDAFQKMLPGLPADAHLSYVIAQHLAPKYRSMLGDLLAKQTRMPIEIIEDGTELQPDTIYITPPNKDVKLSGSRLVLSKASSIGPKPSIDYFFSSLAETKGSHAVGIILSGTGTDGAHGIRAIKSNDGITIVQLARSAKFDGMPNAAIETGSVDLILPPERIGPELESALKYPHLVSREPAKEVNFDAIGRILQLLHKSTGVDFTEYKTSTIFRRTSRRMVLHKLHSLPEYLKYVESNPQELDTLRKDLLISVTSFFRDSKAFEALSKALREVLKKKKPGDTIRAWVPACSSGEEAYSIAILIAEILGAEARKYRVQIFATDIDEDSVQRARKGTYPLATVMDTDGHRFERYFTHRDNSVTVSKAVRDIVILARQDLLKDTPFLHLDLISCRNLLIYFNTELQDKILSLFHFSLYPDGLLFLGKSESVNQKADLFAAVSSKWKIFRRKETLINRMPHLVQKRQSNQMTHLTRAPLSLDRNELWKEREFASSLLSVLNCSAVLVDAQGNIVYIRGDVSPYLKLPEGSVKENLNAISMARHEIRYSLQALLHRAKKEDQVVVGHPLDIEIDGSLNSVRLRVGPVVRASAETYFLAVFDRIEDPKPHSGAGASTSEPDANREAELEQELAVTRDHLQDTLEELETSSEELQSLNEELQSANEELQASNEELETSNEELQASNEELNTVNQELRTKSDELAAALANLEKSEKRYRLLVDNMNEALMVCEIERGRKGLPADLIIRQANKSMEKMLGIDDDELPLRANLVQLPELAAEDLLSRLARIAKGREPQRFEVHLKKLEKDLTLSVYHLDEEMLGVVCRDDTQRKHHERALRRSERKAKQRLRELEAIYSSAPIGLCIFDTELHYLRINEHLAEINGIPAEAHIGKTVADLLPDLADQAEKLKDRILQSGEPVFDIELVGETKSQPGVKRTWVEQWHPLKDEAGQVVAINVVALEITDRKKMEEALRDHQKDLENLVGERTAELEATVEALRKEVSERRKTETELDRLSKVFMDSTDPIIIEDLDGKITDLNNSAEESYGYTREELIGQRIDKLLPRTQYTVARDLRRRCLSDEKVRNWEGMRRHRDGRTYQVLITAFLLKGPDGNSESVVTIAKDISSLKRLHRELEKRAEQLSRLTSELTLAEQRERHRLAGMLHDHLQQLLAGIKLKLETALDKDAPSRTADLEAAHEMVVESLKTSRSLSAELSPPVLFQRGIAEAINWLARRMKKNHDLDVDLHLDSAVALEQEDLKILMFESVRELLFNVVKHAGTGTARIDMAKKGAQFEITVSDEGAGFDPEIIFGENAGPIDGFGLFNIRERLTLLGGDFKIESASGKGSRVTLIAPFVIKAQFGKGLSTLLKIPKPVPHTMKALPPNAATGNRIRVLLVDDHSVMRDGLQSMLSRQPDMAVVGQAADGNEAVALAQTTRPDVILMDINMPGLDGIEATRRITAEFPDIRVIGLSMLESEDQQEIMKKAGAVAYLNKSCGAGELLAAVRQVY